MTVEFDCVDCGWHVVDVAGIRGPRARCLSCEWLAEIPEPADREALRAFLRATPLPSDAPATLAAAQSALARGPPSEAPS
jgi:hypothetical protein